MLHESLFYYNSPLTNIFFSLFHTTLHHWYNSRLSKDLQCSPDCEAR